MHVSFMRRLKITYSKNLGIRVLALILIVCFIVGGGGHILWFTLIFSDRVGLRMDNLEGLYDFGAGRVL